MKRRLVFLVALLAATAFALLPALAGPCVSRTEHNHTFIIRTPSVAQGSLLRAYAAGQCVGEAPVPTAENMALAAWGYDSFSKAGAPAGAPIQLRASSGPLEYALTPVVEPTPALPHGMEYLPEGRTRIASLLPKYAGTVTASWLTSGVTASASGYSAQLRITGSQNVAAFIVSVILTGVNAQAVTPAPVELYAGAGTASYYFVPTTPGAVHTLTFTGPSARGSITVQSIQAVDETGALMTATAFAVPTVQIAPFVHGDASGDGAVSSADVRALFLHVLGLTPLPSERVPYADVYPYPTGDRVVDIRDLYKLSSFLKGGVW